MCSSLRVPFHKPATTMDYPPISSIPLTSPERLALASSPESDSGTTTVLYLAYGSNLCASTFLGARGIRPISKINVSAPALDLSFDLPGWPYREPCFANVVPRKLPKPPFDPPSLLNPPHNVLFPALPPDHTKPTWTKGLIGVVYEIPKDDYYTKIIATESPDYHDIATPCVALPPPFAIPEKPPIPELPRPFIARTLYAPRLPVPVDPPKEKWWQKFLMPVRRPEPDYAEPSPRYLGLILEGAAQHFLPEDYQTYLARLQAYTITHRRQLVGKWLFALLWGPWVYLLFTLSKLFTSGEDGRAPKWLLAPMAVIFNLMWMSYDCFFLKHFGDGERTMDDEDDEDEESRVGRHHSKQWISDDGNGDEKNVFLVDR